MLVFTPRADGDLAVGGDAAALAQRRAQVTPIAWTWLRQVHGAGVVVAGSVGEHAGVDADAVATSASAVPIAVHAADCAPIALVDDAGVVAVVHAGWRGLVAGVVSTAVDAVRELGGRSPRAVLGPCIRPQHYEFGASDLDAVAAALGPTVRSTTTTGSPALDLPAAVRSALAHAGVDDVADLGWSTADDDRWFSHRARRDAGRHALVAWLEDDVAEVA
jgi:YfiH family protein